MLHRVVRALDAVRAGLSQSQPGMLAALSPREGAVIAIPAAAAWMPVASSRRVAKGRQCGTALQAPNSKKSDAWTWKHLPPGRRLRTVHNAFARGLATGALLSVWVLLPLMPVLGVVLSRMSGIR